jgi:hypothetical protein
VGSPAEGPALRLEIPGEQGGVSILYVVKGSASVRRSDGAQVDLRTGDTLTHGQGLVGEPFDCSPDLRMLCFFIAAKAQLLRERTPEEIRRLEALGPGIIAAREVRPDGDTRPVNFLRD